MPRPRPVARRDVAPTHATRACAVRVPARLRRFVDRADAHGDRLRGLPRAGRRETHSDDHAVPVRAAARAQDDHGAAVRRWRGPAARARECAGSREAAHPLTRPGLIPGMGRGARALSAAIATLAVAASSAHAQDPKYALVHGCYQLKASSGQLVAGGPFRMQATDLGRYMLYGKAGNFLGPDGSMISDPGPAADFAVDDPTPNVYTLTGQNGKLGDTFTFLPADGCAVFPEAELNATGTPGRGATPYAATKGFVDAHMHMMGFEFLGGDLHCGRPWSPYGVTVALAGCPREEAASPVVESFLMGDPSHAGSDPVGWPT